MILSSHLYECAMTSESTTEVFNSKVCFCFPLRDETNKTIFVIEIVHKEAASNIKKFETELDQLETVIYVLNLCQRELLDDYFAGVRNSTYGNLIFFIGFLK
jgi:hypothetical protein